MDEWSRAATADATIDRPPWPTEAYSRQSIAVNDDVGTTYRRHSGEAGGEGKEWRAIARFLPLPPARARVLTLTLPDDGAHVSIPLPSGD